MGPGGEIGWMVWARKVDKEMWLMNAWEDEYINK